MKRKIISVISTVIILIISIFQVSYAELNVNSNNEFLSVNEEQIAQNETLAITFNLEKIKYDNFKIILDSNINNNKIYTNDNISLGKKSDSIIINIDKNKLNLNKITVYYSITEDTQINSQIQFNSSVVIEEEIETQDDTGNTVTKKQEKSILESSKNIIVIEKKEETKLDEKNENKDNTNKKEQPNMDNIKTENNKTFNSKINTTKQVSSTGISLSGQKEETATYNGSNNNYLKNLSIKGIELNTSFNKENTNYFVNVTDNSKLKINYKVEDSSAKVSVTGNDNIKEGTNKILIAVTAENGDVRYYRIFVNCILSK